MKIDEVPIPVALTEFVKPKLTPEQEALVKATQEELATTGTLETRTQEQITEDLIKAEELSALKKAAEMGPAEMSEKFFRTFWPLYRQKVSGLSNKAARRVLEALVQWPLEDEEPVFKSEDEKAAFGLGIRLIDSKTIIRDTVELEMLQKREEQKLVVENEEKPQGEIKNA